MEVRGRRGEERRGRRGEERRWRRGKIDLGRWRRI